MKPIVTSIRIPVERAKALDAITTTARQTGHGSTHTAKEA